MAAVRFRITALLIPSGMRSSTLATAMHGPMFTTAVRAVAAVDSKVIVNAPPLVD